MTTSPVVIIAVVAALYLFTKEPAPRVVVPAPRQPEPQPTGNGFRQPGTDWLGYLGNCGKGALTGAAVGLPAGFIGSAVGGGIGCAVGIYSEYSRENP